MIESKMIEVIPTLKATQRTETLKYLEVTTPKNAPVSDAKFIAFRNGILNIRTMELLPFSPEYIITNIIPWDYNSKAYSEVTDKTLNTWSGSTWDGKSIYTKKTQEEYKQGEMTTITAEFRKYPCVEDSIADHGAYLLGAMNGSKQRYAGLKNCKDYKKAIQIIKDGGYATSSTYVQNLCNIIEKWNLTQYNADASPSNPDTVNSFPATPFLVKVIIDDLNYRSEPSMNGKVNGQTGKGTFTIVQVNDGWGKLKSGVFS